MRRTVYCYLVVLLFLLEGCKSQTEEKMRPAFEVYNQGMTFFKEGSTDKAEKSFNQVFFQNPGAPITPYAEIMEAYSCYLQKEYDSAIDILSYFIKMHPGHTETDYAYYLKAMCYYDQISYVLYDQSQTLGAKSALKDVIQMFPGSEYALDCARKLVLVDDHIAGKEISIGKFYLAQKSPAAAIIRFNNVVESYYFTQYAQESLCRLVESYLMLGLLDEAKRHAQVLYHNFGASDKWYLSSYMLIQNYQNKVLRQTQNQNVKTTQASMDVKEVQDKVVKAVEDNGFADKQPEVEHVHSKVSNTDSDAQSNSGSDAQSNSGDASNGPSNNNHKKSRQQDADVQ